ncbi:MAG: hypothetical protein GYA24_22630 [Candidatus Lokiarchaeota archaeon]|nr:hypothetical protein [Candidatus Lokiarchaeota archaeon]
MVRSIRARNEVIGGDDRPPVFPSSNIGIVGKFHYEQFRRNRRNVAAWHERASKELHAFRGNEAPRSAGWGLLVLPARRARPVAPCDRRAVDFDEVS